jgi:hypothetical protein
MFARMNKTLKGEKGMLDLASVITGVIITGVLGAVTAASFIFIIPWFQDKAALDDINLIKVAEDSHYSDTGFYTNDINVLKTKNYLRKTTSKTCITMTSATAPDYTIYVESASKKKYSYIPSNTKPVLITTTIPCTLK